MNAWWHNIIDINVSVSFSAQIITQYCPGNGLDFDNIHGVYEYIYLIS